MYILVKYKIILVRNNHFVWSGHTTAESGSTVQCAESSKKSVKNSALCMTLQRCSAHSSPRSQNRKLCLPPLTLKGMVILALTTSGNNCGTRVDCKMFEP